MPVIYSDTEHFIDRAAVDPDALNVIHRLRAHGYSAYLVGGGVRDLLLGHTPKDFDISTSARPEQIKKVFGRQCLLIGRRFRLAHIRFGHKILEVATFRAGEMNDGLILQDNVWGTEEEDVMRRDFTINGLLYDPETHVVIDHVGGWEDIRSKTLRSIGEPEVRFKQDPVRMIRLLKFKARYGFEIDPKDLSALKECRTELLKSSPARVLEEWLRMLESKASAPFTKLMIEHELLPLLFPQLIHEFTGPNGPEMLRFLEACDHENKKAVNYPIERPVLVAALLYPLLEKQVYAQQRVEGQKCHFGDIMNLTYELIKQQVFNAFSHFPRRISATTSYVLSQQFKLLPFGEKKQHLVRLFKVREFPQALRLLKLRSLVYPQLKELYLNWREHYRHFLESSDHQAHPSIEGTRHRRRRRPTRR